MARFSIPCVIFAGGKSSRMGKDKALLPFCGFSTLSEFQYRRLRPHFKELYLSAKREKFPFDAPLILDDPEEKLFAPTAGLRRIFEVLEEDTVFVLSVDTPFVGIEEIGRLIRSAEEHSSCDAVVAESPGGIHPMCGVYRRSIVPYFQEATERGNHRLTALLERANTHFLPFPFDAPFYNINRPEEYESALKNLS
ncbi:molybdenum cofactor guanylyltransferase MobA [Hydrogenimonas sp.]